MKKYLPIWIVLFVGALVTVVVSENVSPELQSAILKEGGWVETASWVSYFVAAAFILIQILRWPTRWSMLICTMLLGMRELDFDKRFTTMGIFKSRFYGSEEVPLGEKLIAALITAAIVVTLIFLVKDHLLPFIKRITKGEGPSWSILLAGGLMVFAKSIDGLSRKLEPFGIEPSDAVNRIAGSVEECFELSAALLIIVGAVGALLHRSK